jgi:F-type H+-transporting ATPase subunit delta
VSAITNRYACALADVVLGKHLDRQQTAQELALFAQLMESSRELRTIWQNPSVEGVQKRKVLDWIVARAGASQMVRNFIAVLIDRHRISALREVIREVELELNKHAGLTEAEVTSARPMSDLAKRALEARMEELTGKPVLAHYATDASLLGGAVVKAGSTVYDGSLRRQFEELKEQLSST